jgi:hypothetical protein
VGSTRKNEKSNKKDKQGNVSTDVEVHHQRKKRSTTILSLHLENQARETCLQDNLNDNDQECELNVSSVKDTVVRYAKGNSQTPKACEISVQYL